jgi:hypothetical protein
MTAAVRRPRQVEFLVEFSDSAGQRLSGDLTELRNARFEDAAPVRRSRRSRSSATSRADGGRRRWTGWSGSSRGWNATTSPVNAAARNGLNTDLRRSNRPGPRTSHIRTQSHRTVRNPQDLDIRSVEHDGFPARTARGPERGTYVCFINRACRPLRLAGETEEQRTGRQCNQDRQAPWGWPARHGLHMIEINKGHLQDLSYRCRKPRTRE